MITIPGRIPVRIFPLFWLLALIIAWMNAGTIIGTFIWVGVILLSVLIHEYGHALTAVAFKQNAEIRLVAFGGVTVHDGLHLKLWKEFLIVLNGPIAGLLLFFVSRYFLSFIDEAKHPYLSYALEASTYVNLFWTILNLFPVFPLDGGILLRYLLEGLFGSTGIKIANIFSILFSVVASIYFFTIQAVFAGAIFLMFAFESYRQITRDANESIPKDETGNFKKLLDEGERFFEEGKYNEALERLSALCEEAQQGYYYNTAKIIIARIYYRENKFKEAWEMMVPLEKILDDNSLGFLQLLAFQLEKWEKVVEIGKKAYDKKPVGMTAFLNAMAYGIMGQSRAAVGWLKVAFQSGFNDPDEILKKREFDSIRSTPEFQRLVKAYTK